MQIAKHFRRFRGHTSHARRTIRRAEYAACEPLETRTHFSVTANITVVGSAPSSSYSVPAGIPFAVNTTGMTMTDTAAITNNYKWNFGDTTAGSEFNILPGFNAAHIYNTAGSYKLNLTVTASDGSQSSASVGVTVTAAPYTKTYYVDNNPALDNVSNTGLDPAHPLSSFSVAMSDLGSQSNVKVLFRQGETFTSTATGGINGNNVVIGSYWSTDSSSFVARNTRPVIQAVSGYSGGNMLSGWFNDGMIVRDITFDSTGLTSYPSGVFIRGNHAAVIDCQFLHIQDCVKGADPETQNEGSGIIVQDNIVPKVGGSVILEGAGVWLEGWDWSVLGNYYAGSTGENTIRCDVLFSSTNTWQSNRRFLIFGNDINNTQKEGVQFRGYCSDIYFANNTLRNYQLRMGDSLASSTADASTCTRIVVDSNHFLGTYIDVENPVSHVMIRNNVLERLATQANNNGFGALLNIYAWTNNPDSDIEVVNNTGNNTLPDTSSTGPFLECQQSNQISGMVLDNNLYTTASTRTDRSITVAGASSQSLAGIFSEIKTNVWPAYNAADVAEVNGTAYTLSGWNALNPAGSSAGTDQTINVSLDENSFWPGTGVDVTSRSGLAFYNYNGVARYTTPNSISAGALDRNSPGLLFANYDIGSQAPAAGSTAQVNKGGDYNILGGGAGVSGTADQFRYVAKSQPGDFDYKVQITALTDENNGVEAGLMARTDFTAGSANVFMSARPLDGSFLGSQLSWRSSAGGSTSSTGSGSEFAPVTWLRLKRVGNVFTGYSSVDGSTWTQIGQTTVALGTNINFGMAVCANTGSVSNNTALSAAQFRNLAAVAGSTYTGVDIGSGTTAGYSRPVINNGDHEIGSSSSGIGGTADSFRFTYRQVTGDFDTYGMIESFSGGGTTPLAGLMARASLAAGDQNVFSYGTESSSITGNTFGMSYRSASGGSTTTSTSGTATYPEAWVRLTRVGNVFTAYSSPDGVHWVTTGTVTIVMPSVLYVGMAVTSGDNTQLSDAFFRYLT
ncbi:MAG: hypothetical protein JWN24_941 [Phycisphaerales bacterium]|nr:hypothetical protein [Phycisphaerales bacterium]